MSSHRLRKARKFRSRGTDFEGMSFCISGRRNISGDLLGCHAEWWRSGEGLQNVLIQADNSWITEYQEEVFQRFRQPKALHPIRLRWVGDGNVINRCVCNIRVRDCANGGEHVPCLVEKNRIPSDTIEVKDRLNGFWPAEGLSASELG